MKDLRSGGRLLCGVLLVLGVGCAGVSRERGGPGESVEVVKRFMLATVASDHEAAFSLLDLEHLENLGNPQAQIYRSLSPGLKSRYRKDFVEGVYSFLFRDLPPERAVFSLETPDPRGAVTIVTGRPGKRLAMTVRMTAGGARISAVKKVTGD